MKLTINMNIHLHILPMKELNREISINNLLFEVGDNVILPLQEKGVIKNIDVIIWGFNVSVQITKGTFNEIGDIVEYKLEQLELDE